MKKRLVITAAIIVALGVTTVVPVKYAHATEQNWSNFIYPGVYIEDIDVSGKEIVEAKTLIKEKYEKPALNKKIEVQVDGKIYTLNYKDIEVRYNVEDVIKEAFNYGKERSLLEKYKMIKFAAKREFSLVLNYNAKAVDEFVNRIEQDTNKNPINAQISVTNGNITITPEINGAKLEKDKLVQSIKEEVSGGLLKKDAAIKATVAIIKPDITKEKLSSIDSRISSFSTSFSNSNYNRINNIELATKSINGTVLMPGETFSFNETVGERTVGRGYKEAGVIIGDKIESGLGGGICQVSSTLYNTMLKANIKALERRNHSLPLAYIGKGLDATVDWGNIDYKFTNTLNYPIYIEGYLYNKSVYFNIYSSSELGRYTHEMVTEITNTIQPTTKYIDDPNRYEDEEEIVKKPAPGYKINVYRKTYENNKLIKTELVSRDYYMVVNGETIKGTKKR